MRGSSCQNCAAQAIVAVMMNLHSNGDVRRRALSCSSILCYRDTIPCLHAQPAHRTRSVFPGLNPHSNIAAVDININAYRFPERQISLTTWTTLRRTPMIGRKGRRRTEVGRSERGDARECEPEDVSVCCCNCHYHSRLK